MDIILRHVFSALTYISFCYISPQISFLHGLESGT